MSEVESYHPLEAGGDKNPTAQYIDTIHDGEFGSDFQKSDSFRPQEVVDVAQVSGKTVEETRDQIDSRVKSNDDLVKGGARIGFIKDEEGPRTGELRPFFEVTEKQQQKAKREMQKDHKEKLDSIIEEEKKATAEKEKKEKGGELISDEIKKVLEAISATGLKNIEGNLDDISLNPEKFKSDTSMIKELKTTLTAMEFLLRLHVKSEGTSTELKITLKWIIDTRKMLDEMIEKAEEEDKEENKEDKTKKKTSPDDIDKKDKDDKDDKEDKTDKDDKDEVIKKDDKEEIKEEDKIDHALIESATNLYESGFEGSGNVDIALYRGRYTDKLLEKRKLRSKITWTESDNEELKALKKDYEKNLDRYAKQEGFLRTNNRIDGKRPEKRESEEEYQRRVAEWERKNDSSNPYKYEKRMKDWRAADKVIKENPGYEDTIEYEEHLRRKPTKPMSVDAFERGRKRLETDAEYNKRLENWAKTYFEILNEETLKVILKEQLVARIDEEAYKERTEGLFSGAYRRVKNHIRKHPAITAVVTTAVSLGAITLTPLGGIPLAVGMLSGLSASSLAHQITNRYHRSRDQLIQDERPDFIAAMDGKATMSRLGAKAAKNIRVGDGVEAFRGQYDALADRMLVLAKEKLVEKFNKELKKKSGEPLSLYEVDKLRSEILKKFVEDINVSIDNRHDRENTLRDKIIRNQLFWGSVVGLGTGRLTFVGSAMG